MSDELNQLLERWPIAREFELAPGGNIVVVGAYQGVTMELLANLYAPKRIVGYEPQVWAAQRARTRMLEVECQSFVYSYGLGDVDGEFPMGEYLTDGCSFINVGPESREQGKGRMVDANVALEQLGLDKIDLMVMNIEAYEFVLLPYLWDCGWWDNIKSFCIQFHLGFSDDNDYLPLIKALDTHYKFKGGELPTWGYWA